MSDMQLYEPQSSGTYTSSGDGLGPNPGWGGGGLGPNPGWGGGGVAPGSSQSQSGSYIPDYPQSDFLMKIAEAAAQMADAMYKWGQDVYSKVDGITDQLVDQAMASSQMAGGIAADALQRYSNVFQPLENQLIQDANSYASDARIAQNMGAAEAEVQQGVQSGLDASRRDLESYGIDPSSGRYADLDKAYRTMGGAAAAAAGQKARLDTEDRGRAMRSEAIRVGQEYPKNAMNALDTGVKALNVANSANEGRAQAAAMLGRLPAEYLGVAAGLKYPPLGNQSQSASQQFPPSGGGGSGVSSGGSKGGGQKQPGGGGEKGGKELAGPKAPTSGPGGQGGQPGEKDGWKPPGMRAPVTPQTQYYPPGSLPHDYASLADWNPLAGTDFSYLDSQAGDANDLDWGDEMLGGNDNPWADADNLDWGDEILGGDDNPWASADNLDWGDDMGDYYGPDASGNEADPYTDWGYDGQDYGYYEDYGYDASGNEADPYTDWGWGGYDDQPSYQDDGYGDYDDYYSQPSYQDDGYADYGYSDSGYYDDSGGDYSGYDSYYDDSGWGGDYEYAAGGPVMPEQGQRPQRPAPRRAPRPPQGGPSGRMVPPQASPSGGQVQDDVNAKLTPHEFVVPKDVALWKGQEFFQKLIETARQARTGAPAKGKPTKNTGGKPSFSTAGR